MLTKEQIEFLSKEMNIVNESVKTIFQSDRKRISERCIFIMGEESDRENDLDTYDLERLRMAESILFLD